MHKESGLVATDSVSMLASVRLVGLDAESNYTIKLYAEQLSTQLLSKSIDLSFTTQRARRRNVCSSRRERFRSVSKVIRDVHIRRIGSNTIVITWSADDFDQYQIRYWPVINDTTKMLVTLVMNNLTLITTSDNYRIQLRGHVKLAGWTSYTEAKLVALRSMAIDGNLASDTNRTLVDNKSILLIGPFSILGLVITVILLALTYSKQ